MMPLVAITGASSGIGAAAARAFAAAGHPLVLMARRRDRIEALGLADALVREVNVTDRVAVEGAIRDAEGRYGPVDLLINNAGLMPLAKVVDQEPVDWQQMFDVNCVALLNVSQVVLPGMIERHHGTIMNLGSIAGKTLYGNHTAYCGTKYAVHAITEGMRRELASSNVRVTLVAPGMVDTELLDVGAPAGLARSEYVAYREHIGGPISPDHVARAMVMAYSVPQSVCIREVVLAPTTQDA